MLIVRFFTEFNCSIFTTNRFLQKRFIWGPSNKLSATHHRSYLNLAPSQYDNSLNVCFADHSQCEEDIDLVYYSKHENVTDYTQYDWLITADKR